ncbi:DUF11/DUF58 family protein [Natronomonas pharaonis DSM 2160]|uniref:DUF11/DUF58 family protein n=1 Tax=Natronomonas pharaonis (strain ATCC 35678 / DSM 2160 / CIP 103997 / JCM 8858 / NBRC 14720 / NCIMB 2260 / Gabara) TaxID=348780 RepID=A0A1U7EYU5_NATPD|nr:DUF58 domain-containing protein [Natronomonas pharaonis]CAI50414.2 DUF11/DUF58 family protein [Natronomonas pharaonis DSM 2160]
MGTRHINRLNSGVTASATLVAAGVTFGSAALLLAAAVPITYLGYAAVSSVPDPEAKISVTRELTPRNPLPGRRVEVTLTVRNESSRTLADVRIVDQIPDNLELADGKASSAVTLQAGEATEITYTLRPRRGTYVFDDAWVRVRSLSAASIGTASIPVTGDTELECTVPLDGLPVYRETVATTGSVASDRGGNGTEFYATREYRHGDSLSRIDWRRYARTGELGTVLYREQETTNIIVLVDGREKAGVAPAPGQPGGLTLAAYAGLITSSAAANAGHNVGVVGLGVDSELPGVYRGPPAYVPPGNGADIGGRIARVCDAIAARGSGTELSTTDGDEHTAGDACTTKADGGTQNTQAAGVSIARLEALLPATAQLVVCTPAIDDEGIDLIAKLRQRGYPTAVVSPDVNDHDSIGARLADVRRQARLERLRRLDVAVTDWDPKTPLASAFNRGIDEVIR